MTVLEVKRSLQFCLNHGYSIGLMILVYTPTIPVLTMTCDICGLLAELSNGILQDGATGMDGLARKQCKTRFKVATGFTRCLQADVEIT